VRDALSPQRIYRSQNLQSHRRHLIQQPAYLTTLSHSPLSFLREFTWFFGHFFTRYACCSISPRRHQWPSASGVGMRRRNVCDGLCRARGRNMSDEVRSCRSGYDGCADGFSGGIAREVVGGEVRGGEGACDDRPGCSRHVVSACRYIDAHYDEAISLTYLAGVVGCSRRYLAERFRRETGETVHGYLTRVRLNRAGRDMRAGDKVAAVMLGVGIRGRANFYRHFKARFGVTPAEYRARDRGSCVPGDLSRGIYEVTLALTGSA
jgi:AraC-like DNA-binding protein